MNINLLHNKNYAHTIFSLEDLKKTKTFSRLLYANVELHRCIYEFYFFAALYQYLSEKFKNFFNSEKLLKHY